MSFGSIVLAVVLWIIQFIGWTLFCALFAIWWGQQYILYLPTIGQRSGVRRKVSLNAFTSRSPAEQQLPYEEFFLTTSDNVLIHTWFLPHPTLSRTAPTILFFHGNAGNRLFNAQQFITDAHCNVFLVEYRGFGNSTGTPSEHGFHLDALCSLDFLRSKHNIDTKRIFVFGRSLGGAVAIWLAAQRPAHIAGLIVENTFTCIEDMAVHMLKNFNIFPATSLEEGSMFLACFRKFLYLFMTSHWRSIDLISSISKPTLMLSGLSDELIAPEQMKTLFSNIPSNIYRRMHCVETGTHNDTYIRGGDEYWKVIDRFLTISGAD